MVNPNLEEATTTIEPTTVYDEMTTTIRTTTMTLNFETTTFPPAPTSCKTNEKVQILPACSQTLAVNSNFNGRGRLFSAEISIELPMNSGNDFGILIQSEEPIHDLELENSDNLDFIRFDEYRVMILAAGNDPAEVFEGIRIFGLSLEKNFDVDSWFCSSSAEANFTQNCIEIDPRDSCPSDCWEYDNVTETCVPPEGSVRVDCSDSGISLEFDQCLLPEGFQYWSTTGPDKKMTCGGQKIFTEGMWRMEDLEDCEFEIKVEFENNKYFIVEVSIFIVVKITLLPRNLYYQTYFLTRVLRTSVSNFQSLNSRR